MGPAPLFRTSGPAVVALALSMMLPLAGHAQSTNGTIKACWVEGSGVLYRRDTTGAPAACTRATHRPIEWTLGTIPAFTLPVPMNLSGSSTSAILSLTQTGTGQALFANGNGTSAVARFERNSGAGSTLAVVNQAVGDGMGVAIVGQSQGSQATAQLQNTGIGGAINARSTSTGPATITATNLATDQGQALYAENKGTNTTISAINSGTTGGGAFYANSNATYSTATILSSATGSTAGALYAESKGNSPTIGANNVGTANGAAIQGISRGSNATGNFINTSTANGGAMYLENNGPASAVEIRAKGGGTALWTTSNNQNGVVFENTGTGQNISILGISNGVWPTAQFESRGTGAALRTVGSAVIVGALTVNGNTQINGNYAATGTKNAVVPTSTGTREMYTEEATEVWFADYGQAALRDSVVWVPFDATFAETIESGRPYHVFLQAYADASLYVSRRTAEGFEVRLTGDRAPAKPIEFSFRLVAKRRGYGDRRLTPHALETSTQAPPSGARN